MDPSPLADGVAACAVQPLPTLLAAVTVDLDQSVFLQMALFSALILVLKPLLFEPMLRVFALREARTDGAKAEARAMQERAAELLSSYESELLRARMLAASERDELRRETAALEASILSEARAAADLILSDGRARMAREIGQLEQELAQRQPNLSARISSQVLGRELSS